MRYRIVLIAAAAAALSLSGPGAWTALAATNFNVGASGMSAYVIDGANNPTVTLTRGQTYTFTVNTFGHPFWITTAPGAGDAESNAFSQGVTGNGAGASPGTLTFVVPPSAPATLFYQCSFHDPMFGTFNIVGSTAVPSVGPLALAALAVLLLLLAAVVIRRQKTTAAMRSQDQ